MKVTQQFLSEFRRIANPTNCHRCRLVPSIIGNIFCVDCQDDVDLVTMTRNSTKMDDELPEGMHTLTKSGLSRQWHIYYPEEV